VVEHVTNLVTREAVLSWEEAAVADLVPVLALERRRGEQAFWGLLKGLGLREGAYATSTAWDSPDLLVIGRDGLSVRTALTRLVEIGGGVVFARGADVVAESKEPICAVACLDTLEKVRADLRAVTDALHEAGVPWEDPILAVDTLTTPAIPHLRVTHRGYVRLRDRALLPVEG
jgi:adenine deaminase